MRGPWFDDGPSVATGHIFSGRKGYVLALLFVVFLFNFLDRQIIVILSQQIKAEFDLKDWQLGFMTGTVFAIFYATIGLPIAYFADRGNRVNIIAGALVVWSAMTSSCAAAQSFGQLLLARVGVGAGEAGGTPPAMSLLSSYFDRGQRATAISIYMSGATIGTLVGFIFGGWIGQVYGWRVAMLVAGLPGIALAILVKLTIPEPRSAGAAATVAEAVPVQSLVVTARLLFGKRDFALACIAIVAAAIPLYGFMVWAPVYLMREFGLSTREVGVVAGLNAGIAGTIGTFAAGWLSDRLVRRDPRWQMRVPAVTSVIFCASVLGLCSARSYNLALVFLACSYMATLAYTGPAWSSLQTIVAPNVRATASAVTLFFVNLVGMSLGPQLVGILSDQLHDPVDANHGLRLAIIFVILGALPTAALFWIAAKALGRVGEVPPVQVVAAG